MEISTLFILIVYFIQFVKNVGGKGMIFTPKRCVVGLLAQMNKYIVNIILKSLDDIVKRNNRNHLVSKIKDNYLLLYKMML